MLCSIHKRLVVPIAPTGSLGTPASSQAEIGYHDARSARRLHQHDIGRFEVTVHDADVVGSLECGDDLTR